MQTVLTQIGRTRSKAGGVVWGVIKAKQNIKGGVHTYGAQGGPLQGFLLLLLLHLTNGAY